MILHLARTWPTKAVTTGDMTPATSTFRRSVTRFPGTMQSGFVSSRLWSMNFTRLEFASLWMWCITTPIPRRCLIKSLSSITRTLICPGPATRSMLMCQWWAEWFSTRSNIGQKNITWTAFVLIWLAYLIMTRFRNGRHNLIKNFRNKTCWFTGSHGTALQPIHEN